MASFQKGSEEWIMFMEYWELCKKYWIPKDTDAYWDSLIKDVDAFYKKYKSDFARALANALADEAERKIKLERKKNNV